MKINIIIPVACVLVGSVAGFIIGKSSSPDNAESSSADQLELSSYRSASLSRSSQSADEKNARKVRSLKEALAKPSQTGRMEALMDYFANLDPSYFAEEAEKLNGLPMSDRLMVSYLLFSRWGEVDPLSAMSYTKTMGRMSGFVNGMVLKSWASENPAEAAQYYTENSGDFMTGGRGPNSQGSAGVIAAEWAIQDKEAALEWAQSLEGRDGDSAMSGIFNQIASDDPAAAALMLSTITSDSARLEAQNTVAREWGSQDWSAAEAWISSLPADQQGSALSQALRGLSDEDYLAAAQKLTSLPNIDDFANTMEAIARDWSRDDPAASAQWIMEYGDEEAQVDSIGPAVASWVNVDKASAYEFVSQQELGAVRDEAVSYYIAVNRNGDTNENLALAESITDSNDRARAISRSISGWISEDKDAATAYVNSSEFLSEEQKTQVIQRASDGGGNRRRGRN